MKIKALFEAYKSIMPNIMDRVNPPISDEELDGLRAMYDFEIDPLYIEFLQTCNGEKDTLMMGGGLWMIDTVRAGYYHRTEWMDWHSIADNAHLCKDQYYSRKRVPIIEDGGGSSWFLDYDPAEEGRMGQVICVFRDQPEIVYNCFDSFEALVDAIIHEIKSGGVSVDDVMHSFQFSDLGRGIDYYGNKSAGYRKEKVVVPDGFFQGLSADWLFAVSEAINNPIINRDGKWAKPQQALAVKSIYIKNAAMMEHFCEHMRYLPNVSFLHFAKDVELKTEHYDVIKKLRLHTLRIECEVRNIKELANADCLSKLGLARTSEADLGELIVYKNLISLDLQRINDAPSLSFLPQMDRVESLELWHKQQCAISPEHVAAIAKMPKLQMFSTFNTLDENLDEIKSRPSPFYCAIKSQVGFDR